MTTPTHENLTAALAAVQAELPDITKDKTARVKTDKANYSYSYADLASISRIVLPLLGRHGLAWTAKPTTVDGVFVLAYALKHSSGDADEGIFPLPDPARTAPQAIGSAITYARRYALCSVTGIAPDEDDDDAARAQHHHQEQRQRQQEPAPAPAAPAPTGPPAAHYRDRITADPWMTADQLIAIGREAYAAGRLDEVITTDTGDEMSLGDWIKQRGREARAREQQAGEVQQEPGDEPAPPADPAETAEEQEKRRRTRMHALFGELGYSGDANRAQRLQILGKLVARDVASSNDLAWPKEVEYVISALEARQRSGQTHARELEGAPA